MVRPATKLALGTAAVAAGALATRKIAQLRDQTLDEWAAAGDPADVDMLVFPEGDAFTVTTDDGTEIVGVDVDGSGPPVLLVHGYTGTRGHWGPVALALAEAGHRVIAYEQRGHGDSTAGDDGFTMAALGDDMRAVLEHLDLRDVTIAGHSMGGMALQSYLGRHASSARNRVRLAVLTSTGPAPSPQPAMLVRVAPALLGSAVLDNVLGDPRKGSFGLRQIVGTEVKLSHLDAARRTLLSTPHATRAGAFKMLTDFDLSVDLDAIEVPTLIVVGTRDELTRIDQSRRLDELIPHAELHVFEGAGHMLPWERTEELTELIEKKMAEAQPRVG